jgi:hypothetical protein
MKILLLLFDYQFHFLSNMVQPLDSHTAPLVLRTVKLPLSHIQALLFQLSSLALSDRMARFRALDSLLTRDSAGTVYPSQPIPALCVLVRPVPPGTAQSSRC